MSSIRVAAVLPLAFFAACATTAPPTAQERIANVGLSYKEADKQISQTEKDLTSFEESVAELRETAAKSKNMRTKAAYDETLARLDRRLQETRADLEFLKETNRRGGAEYNQQLENAATQIQRSSDEYQAE
jgi:predicted  nucleic acid-binding Zn-ribbon protein